jgi:hypothetical protein
LGQVLVDSSFTQENMTCATNDSGAMIGENQTWEGNQTQLGSLNNLEALGGILGGKEINHNS